jgi:hypothetical protein
MNETVVVATLYAAVEAAVARIAHVPAEVYEMTAVAALTVQPVVPAFETE